MQRGNDGYLLDTSAILAAWQGEAGGEEVRDILERSVQGAHRTLISFMTVFECLYIVARRGNAIKAAEIYHFLHSFPFTRVDMDEEVLRSAADLKSKYQLSVCDAWIAATAMSRAAVLVHRDSEFDPISEVSQLKLPR